MKAFARMLPVFRHPRCLNCHGAVDPASPAHKGVDQLDPEIDRMTDREAYEEQCQECHDQMPGLVQGWTTPGSPVFFVDKSDEELCLQMKRFERTGEDFVEHLDNDHFGVQFIAAGFVGDRALGDQGMVDHGVVAEKPPGTQAQLVQQAQTWVDLLGDGYQASPECGCVMPKMKLAIDHTMSSEVPRGLPSKEESHVRFEIELAPTGDPRITMLAGERTVNREIRMTLPSSCRGNASRQERWMVYALVDSTTGSITVRHTVLDDEPVGEIVCQQPRGTARMGIFPGHVSMVDWEAVIPADSSSTTLRAEDVGSKEALTITVLEVP